MKIPAFLLQHKITVKPFLGNFSHGPKFDTPVTYRCFIEDQTTMVLDMEGKEVVSSARVFLDPSANVPLQSAVIYNGRETTVIDVKRRDGGKLPVPSHLEVILK